MCVTHVVSFGAIRVDEVCRFLRDAQFLRHLIQTDTIKAHLLCFSECTVIIIIIPMMQSDQREHVLMGSSAEDARLVAEAQTPAQQATPVRVTIVVVMDDTGETQSHVTEERRVLHHVRVR